MIHESLHYSIEQLRTRYVAIYDYGEPGGQWVYTEWLDDDGSEDFHPFYEIVRRSTATSAFAEGLYYQRQAS